MKYKMILGIILYCVIAGIAGIAGGCLGWIVSSW